MGSLPQVSVMSGERRQVAAAPLVAHFARLAKSQETALVYRDETCNARVSFAELHGRASAMARAVAARARPSGRNSDGDFVVAVCMQPTHNTVTALLAIWKAGAAYVPMEPSFPQARVSHILSDARPALVIYDDSANPAMFNGSGIPAVSFEELLHESSGLSTEEPAGSELLTQPGSDSVGIVLYTSGSTGIPKGVRITYDAICNRLWWQFSTFPYSGTERCCVWKTALTFVDSISEMWGPLLHGRTLVVLPKEVTRDPQRLVKVLADNQVERLVLVPTLLRSILMSLSLNPSERPLKSLKLWVCSGETLTKELAGEFFSYFGDNDGYKLANFYGSTEVMGDVTYHVLEKRMQLDAHSSVPIGIPVYNCKIYLLDPELSPVRVGAAGEVWVAGRGVARGYAGGAAGASGAGSGAFRDNPHATSPEFARLYRTGDFGVLEKGVLLYSGRRDAQVKIRGHRVGLPEVESAINALPAVEKGVVLCHGAETDDPQIVAFVTLRDNVRLTSHQLEAQLEDKLTSYMIPQVMIIESIPLLVNGKVDRQALLKMYETTNNNDDSSISYDIDYSSLPPARHAAARALLETVATTLGRGTRGSLSLRASFYQLGGNSLNSIFTITRLRERGYYIQISDFLSAANLGEVLNKMTTDPSTLVEREEPQFTPEPMRDEHKQQVIDMVVSSFYEKAELEQFVKHEIEEHDYAECIAACWRALLAAQLSVVLADESGKPVAVALNFDAHDEPEIELKGGLAKIMAFLEYVEGSVRDTMLPEGKGTILHSFMMATATELSASENVSAIKALEDATMRVARERGYTGVFTTNTSPLTQQLGTDVLGFQTLLDYQINQYVDANNEAVFGKAPDDMRAVVCWKVVE